ncbi:MAG: GTP 3',8-cyclase MoaA [Planctomycetota bacterium]
MTQSDLAKPISLRISVTDRCQHRCLYCMPAEGVPKCSHDEIVSFEEIVRFVRTVQSHLGVTKVHLTGGEPLVRANIVDLVDQLARIEAEDLALTTNGHGLRELAPRLKRAGLKRINISLDTLSPETFCNLTRGGRLQDTMAGLDAALQCGLTPIKLNTTVLRGINDHEVVPLVRFAMASRCEIRFLEVMPIGPAQQHFDRWFVSSAEVRAALSQAFELVEDSRRPGVSARPYRITDGQAHTTVGFISSNSQPFCAGCRRLRLTAAGQLVGCLAMGEGPNIRSLLASTRPAAQELLVEQVLQALRLKRTDYTFVTENLMSHTGG